MFSVNIQWIFNEIAQHINIQESQRISIVVFLFEFIYNFFIPLSFYILNVLLNGITILCRFPFSLLFIERRKRLTLSLFISFKCITVLVFIIHMIIRIHANTKIYEAMSQFLSKMSHNNWKYDFTVLLVYQKNIS